MDIMLAYALIVAGLVIGGAVVWTWTVVHQAATEAREWYRRQNAAAAVEDAETDALMGDWESAR